MTVYMHTSVIGKAWLSKPLWSIFAHCSKIILLGISHHFTVSENSYIHGGSPRSKKSIWILYILPQPKTIEMDSGLGFRFKPFPQWSTYLLIKVLAGTLM